MDGSKDQFLFLASADLLAMWRRKFPDHPPTEYGEPI
jgi:hypothetical protein